MSSLTQKNKIFFKENGYLLVQNILSDDQIEAAVDVLWKNMNLDREDNETEL